LTDVYELEIDIDAPRERVWRALTDARELEQWFAERADVSLDDGRFDFWGRYTPDAPAESPSAFVDFEPEKRLRFRWTFRGADATVEITLDGDTRVRVVHSGVAERKQGGSHTFSHFWGFALSDLRGYLEVGRTAPRFDYSWPHMGGFEAHAHIDASPDEVFAEEARRWRAQGGRLEEGYSYIHPAQAAVKLFDVRPGEGWSMEWNELGDDVAGVGPRDTVMTYTLKASGGGTTFTIVHSGFDPDADIQGMATGFFSGVRELAWALHTKGTWPAEPAAGVRVLREPSHDPSGAAELLANLVRERSHSELPEFIRAWGGPERVVDVLLKGLRDRIEPRERCVVGFAVGAEFCLRAAPGEAALERGLPADAEAVVRMPPEAFVRALADESIASLPSEGDADAIARLFSMARRGADAR
jgi:uncharacterized protein YndB with AHSA1/START domain